MHGVGASDGKTSEISCLSHLLRVSKDGGKLLAGHLRTKGQLAAVRGWRGVWVSGPCCLWHMHFEAVSVAWCGPEHWEGVGGLLGRRVGIFS
jgi:hypothetical protein